MKQWQETREILDRLAELTDAGGEAAVACVVAISGSAYRRPGARFLIAPDGTTLGGISGGCLEEDVRQNGLRALQDGNCRLLHYETGDDEDSLWGLGLGCDGEVDVLVVPTTRGGFLAASHRMRGLLAGDHAFAAVTIVDAGAADGGLVGSLLLPGTDMQRPLSTGDDELDEALAGAAADVLTEGRSRLVETGGVRAFVDAFLPPPVLAVCGAGDDAMPMVGAAARVGFRVVVVDHRPAYLTHERFPDAWRLVQALPEDDAEGIPNQEGTFVVLKTHNLERDKAWARRFAATDPAYLGLLGPRARCEEVAAEAGDELAGRAFGPVGLDLGAEGPEQVGISVVSELLAVLAGRKPGHLRDRQSPIHD